jgi:glutamate-ammonia-ligase adenylyltransferase
MAALSRLADETLAAAYAIAVAGLPDGTPEPRLAVVAMGKSGGNELNYVSDVDVIFVAAGDEDLSAGTTVAARIIDICGQVAWPVDAALRPEGSRGPLVRTLASHQAYYRRWARTWEFQALLKARPAAGDLELAREWIDDLAPLLWHAAERPEAVEDVRDMRRKIIDNVPADKVDREIKRGPGGLRDIEFAVQLLQLVHGRIDETLRQPGTLPALRALVAGGYVGRQDGETLLRGYRFLRGVEHRLQLQHLRRTHTVPDDPQGLRWLAGALGYTALPGRDAVEAFRSDWVAHAAQVRRLHVKLLYQPLLEAVARVPAEALRMTPESAGRRLEILGFADPANALRHLQALTGGVTRTAAIQRTLLPMLLSEFADAPEPDRGLLNYRHVSDKLGSTPWYLRLLRDGGSPACSACPGMPPICSSGIRRRCACWPTTRSCSPAPGRRSSTVSRPSPTGTPTRTRRSRRCGRCAAANSSGWPAPTSSAGPAISRRPARWTSTRSASRSPTSPTPR